MPTTLDRPTSSSASKLLDDYAVSLEERIDSMSNGELLALKKEREKIIRDTADGPTVYSGSGE
jgi:hypothetical protein